MTTVFTSLCRVQAFYKTTLALGSEKSRTGTGALKVNLRLVFPRYMLITKFALNKTTPPLFQLEKSHPNKVGLKKKKRYFLYPCSTLKDPSLPCRMPDSQEQNPPKIYLQSLKCQRGCLRKRKRITLGLLRLLKCFPYVCIRCSHLGSRPVLSPTHSEPRQ